MADRFSIRACLVPAAIGLLVLAATMERASAAPSLANGLTDQCADGAVNGLITVSIAATVALFAEIALPAYPILFTVGPAVGCPVRIIGEWLKASALGYL